jgi:hypothetical protein
MREGSLAIGQTVAGDGYKEQGPKNMTRLGISRPRTSKRFMAVGQDGSSSSAQPQRLNFNAPRFPGTWVGKATQYLHTYPDLHGQACHLRGNFSRHLSQTADFQAVLRAADQRRYVLDGCIIFTVA